MDKIKLDEFPVVAAGQTFTLVDTNLDETMSVMAIIFELGGTFTKAQIEELKIILDGKDLVPGLTGDQLQKYNTYTGLTDDATKLVHWFGDPTARTIRGQWQGALDLSEYPGKRLTIRGKVNGAAITPALQCWALVGVPKLEMGIGFDEVDAVLVRALIKSVAQPAAAVTEKSYGIGLGSEWGARLRRIGFFHSGALTSVEMRKGGEVKHENMGAGLNDFIQGEFARVPVPNLYMLDRIEDGNQGEAETTLKDDGSAWAIQVKLSTSGPDTIDAVADVHTAVPLI